MGHHSVVIKQLRTGGVGGAYLNVIDNSGVLCVWGAHRPAHLIGDGAGVYGLITFDDEAWADEWLKENKESWPYHWPLPDTLALSVDHVTQGVRSDSKVSSKRPADDVRRTVG